MTDNKQYPEMPEPTAWRSYDNLLKRARYNAVPITSMQPGIYSHTRMFTEDQMYAYVDADRAMRAAPVAWRRLCYRGWEYEDGITSFEHDPSAQALYTEPQATPASQDAEGAPTSPGLLDAAAYIDSLAAYYADDHTLTDPDTGETEFEYGEAGRDYYSTLVELANDLRARANQERKK